MFTGRQQIISGAVAVVSQLLAIGVVFWLIKSQLGAEKLGLWSIILSTLSITNISGFGLGQAMVHFTQEARKPAAHPLAFVKYFQTAITLTLAFFLLLALVVYFPILHIITDIAGSYEIGQIKKLLILILISLCAALLSRVTQFTLTGQGWFWLGQTSVVLGSILYIAITLQYIDELGLLAVAYGHLAMSVGTFLMGLIGVVWVNRSSHNSAWLLFPLGFHLTEFRKMFALGFSFQLTSLLMLLLEPLARFSIGYTSGLALVGYYEMANRFVVTARELVARPTAYLSERFALLQNSDPKDSAQLFKLSVKRFSMLGCLMFAGLLSTAVPVADYWVQERNWFFFASVVPLAIGWSLSVVALAPWYWGVGVGYNRFNLISVLIMVLISSLFCAGAYLSGAVYLVPIGIGISIVIGDLYLIRRVSKNFASESESSTKDPCDDTETPEINPA